MKHSTVFIYICRRELHHGSIMLITFIRPYNNHTEGWNMHSLISIHRTLNYKLHQIDNPQHILRYKLMVTLYLRNTFLPMNYSHYPDHTNILFQSKCLFSTLAKLSTDQQVWLAQTRDVASYKTLEITRNEEAMQPPS